ncbi:MAG: hypothetical protein GQE15_31940 [Archangiaceae bacterium]|nr:hypothetical protein [Archangiaceae bacterium]
MAATAVVTFALSRSVTFAFVMCAVSLPLQLMALANEFLGTCLAVAGSGLVGVSTALIAAALSSGAVGGLGIELGLVLGSGAAWLCYRHYRRVIQSVNEGEDWY